MRELERDLPATTDHPAPAPVARLAILGTGRAGGSIARAAEAGGVQVEPLGRVDDIAAALGGTPERSAVLLCVPDAEIPAASERAAASGAAWVGHSSGATPLSALNASAAAGARTFSLHPLQTIPTPVTDLTGAPCAIAARDGETLAMASALAMACGMRPFEVPEDRRAAYHAAAAIASNFLVALEESAAALMEAAGVSEAREVLAPLVLRSAANWADAGGDALTGPIARGDEDTVARHLEALRERAPELLPLYEALAERTRALAETREQSR